MKITSFSATYLPYEINPLKYHGKDIVHTGHLLSLNPKIAWSTMSSQIKNKIKQAINNKKIIIKKVQGTPNQIKKFRTIWFDPEDKTIPLKLDKSEIMYLAYLNKMLVGGLILTPSGNNLFMHNLGANMLGKKHHIPALLLWNAVNDLNQSKYQFIDIGVSFRKPLYDFFKHFSTTTYPIIFEPPFIKPHITLSPFKSQITIYKSEKSSHTAEHLKIIEKHFGQNLTILPRSIYSIGAILKYLNLKPNDNVAIFKTFNDNDFLSRCVSETIQSFCTVSRKITKQTKAVMVIHEFGYPYLEIVKLAKLCHQKKIPLIENCTWAYKIPVTASKVTGDFGDYAIFSLPKIFPIQHGSILKGLNIQDQDNWDHYGYLDYYKREAIVPLLVKALQNFSFNQKRQKYNWHYLANLFLQEGFKPLLTPKHIYPTTLMVEFNSQNQMQDIFERFTSFGIESARYYHKNALIIPIHSQLTEQELDYIFATFRGYLNLCHSYKS